MSRKKKTEKLDPAHKLKQITLTLDLPPRVDKIHNRVFVVHNKLSGKPELQLFDNPELMSEYLSKDDLKNAHWIITQCSATEPPSGPKGFLIDLFIPAVRAEDCRLELDKAYERWEQKYGSRRATRMFAWHSAMTVLGYWIDWARKRLNVLKIFSSN